MFKRTCVVVALALSALVFAASRARAGRVGDFTLVIDAAGRQVDASMYGTRNSPDEYAYVGCSVQAFPGRSVATCEAGSGEKSKSVSCSSSDPHIVAAAHSLGPHDSLTFLWNAAGECTYLKVMHYSDYGPAR